MTEDQNPRRARVPSHLFNGRVRTGTLVLCLVWLALWATYLFLNQPEEAPAGTVLISETPYVPYTPPAQTTEQWYPTTTEMPPTETPTDTTTPSETPATPSDTPVPTTGTRQPTVTTTDANPFRLPQIPGLPGFGGESSTEQTGEPGQ